MKALHQSGAAGCPCESQVSFADHLCQHRCAFRVLCGPAAPDQRFQVTDPHIPSWSAMCSLCMLNQPEGTM